MLVRYRPIQPLRKGPEFVHRIPLNPDKGKRVQEIRMIEERIQTILKMLWRDMSPTSGSIIEGRVLTPPSAARMTPGYWERYTVMVLLEVDGDDVVVRLLIYNCSFGLSMLF